MNKRIKNKLMKRKVIDILKNELIKIKKHYKIYDIKYNYCNNNSHVVFRVSGVHNFLFAIFYTNNEIIFAGEIWDFIDKFKPSRLYVSTKEISKFIDAIYDIQNNYKYHFISSSRFYRYFDEEKLKMSYQTIEEEYDEYIKHVIHENKVCTEIKNDVYNFLTTEIFNKYKDLEKIGINDQGEYSVPRFYLLLKFNHNAKDNIDYNDIYNYISDKSYEINRRLVSEYEFELLDVTFKDKELKHCDNIITRSM